MTMSITSQAKNPSNNSPNNPTTQLTLETLLKKLASYYREYGNIPVCVETDTQLIQLHDTTSFVDVDIFNVDPDGILLVIDAQTTN